MFTEHEQAYLDQTFKLVQPRLQYKLDPGFKKHIRKALKYRMDKIGFIGKEGHELTFAIFEKLGYSHDGVTTLEEAKRQEEARREAVKNEWKQKKREMIEQINARMTELKQLQQDIVTFEEKFDAKRKQLQAQAEAEFKERMDTLKKMEQSALVAKSEQQLKQMKFDDLRALAKTNNVKYYYKMNKEELVEALS